jgi:hypothetical protein
MDEYIQSAMNESLAGIEAEYWLEFFKPFQQNPEERVSQQGGETRQHPRPCRRNHSPSGEAPDRRLTRSISEWSGYGGELAGAGQFNGDLSTTSRQRRTTMELSSPSSRASAQP